MKKHLLCILFIGTLNSAIVFNSPDFFKPKTNTAIETNYCIENNNFEYLETMTISIENPRFILFFSEKETNGLFVEAINQLKKEARNKYGNNVGIINVTKVERNNLIFPLFILYYKEEIIISADIIKFDD
mgnify:CR=1 FL=1